MMASLATRSLPVYTKDGSQCGLGKPYVMTKSPPEAGSTCKLQPLSLRNLAINSFCLHYKLLCRKIICECPTDPTGDIVGHQLSVGDIQIPSSISEDILSAFVNWRLLNDETIQIFNSTHTSLQHVSIKHSPVTLKGLQILYKHNISELHIEQVKASLDDVISDYVLSPRTEASLKTLSIYDCKPSRRASTDMNYKPDVATVEYIAKKMTNIVSLSLVDVDLTDEGLNQLCRNLSPTLTCLDISQNKITDINPLTYIAGQLRSLSMYNLYSLKETSYEVLAYKLQELRHLDISCDTGHQLESFLNEEISPLAVEKLLSESTGLQKIVSLDVSGRETVTAKLVRAFLLSHPDVRFLGLMMTPASHSEEWYESRCQDDNPKSVPRRRLKVVAIESEEMILDCLERYQNRGFFVHKALVSLFQMVNLTTDPHHHIIQAVVKAMVNRLSDILVQIAGSACLYYLTRQEIAHNIHTECLKQMAACILAAMTKFPSNMQLQKNCILTLCNDAILMDVDFDRFRCADLVMQCLCKFEDATLIKMGVGIISIIPAKISIEETKVIATNRQYMTRLIEITRHQMARVSVDATMRFSLSAIWNLTDESPDACKVFYELQGIDLAIECMKVYTGYSNPDMRLQIQIKVVGLLNNVAEVPSLRGHLITPEFLALMRESLSDNHIEYSYFSIGILSNLICDLTNPAWKGIDKRDLDLIKSDMLARICRWTEPQYAMVAYRCFRPFVPMFASGEPAVQLWALWAIHHVCTKSPEKYISMLFQEGIYGDIKRLTDRSSCAEVRELSRKLHKFITQCEQSNIHQI